MPIRRFHGRDGSDLAVRPGAEPLDEIALAVEAAAEYVDQEGVRVALRWREDPHGVPPIAV